MTEEKLYKDRNLQIIFGVTLMAVMGVSNITPAFPRIVEELQISKTDVGMLIVAFTLPGMLLGPFVGILADRLGRKRLLIPSLFLFGVAGGACAFTRDFNILLALRIIQGVGGAGLSSLYMILIVDLYSGERRTAALGLNTSALSIGTTSYPLIGGVLATFGWNYPFLISFIAIPIGFIALKYLDVPEVQSGESLKAYLSGAFGYIKTIRVIGVLVAGAIAFTLLFGAMLNYFSLYLGTVFKATPFVIGIITSTSSITTALVASQLGRMSRVLSIANLVKLSFATCGVALLSIMVMPVLPLFLLSTILWGLGWAVIPPGLQSYVSEQSPPEYRAIIMSINSTTFRVGQTLGPVVMGLAYVYGDFKGTFLFAGALALATALVGFIGGKLLR